MDNSNLLEVSIRMNEQLLTLARIQEQTTNALESVQSRLIDLDKRMAIFEAVNIAKIRVSVLAINTLVALISSGIGGVVVYWLKV